MYNLSFRITAQRMLLNSTDRWLDYSIQIEPPVFRDQCDTIRAILHLTDMGALEQ